VGEVHETLLSTLGSGPSGSGAERRVHLVAAMRSDTIRRLSFVSPRAAHTVAETHETAVSAPRKPGAARLDHRPPLRRSINGIVFPDRAVNEPTARHVRSVWHETAPSDPSTAAAGRAGSSKDQRPRCQRSTNGRTLYARL
jgi:hypothetical protein